MKYNCIKNVNFWITFSNNDVVILVQIFELFNGEIVTVFKHEPWLNHSSSIFSTLERMKNTSIGEKEIKLLPIDTIDELYGISILEKLLQILNKFFSSDSSRDPSSIEKHWSLLQPHFNSK